VIRGRGIVVEFVQYNYGYRYKNYDSKDRAGRWAEQDEGPSYQVYLRRNPLGN